MNEKAPSGHGEDFGRKNLLGCKTGEKEGCGVY